MRYTTIVGATGAILITALGATGVAMSQPSGPGGWHGCPGMMGPGRMGWGGYQYPANPSVGDVKAYIEQWVASMGNPRLKVGPVTEKDANTIVGEVVTQDGSLVQRFEVDRRTGVYRAAA